jgi:hypothetical protein
LVAGSIPVSRSSLYSRAGRASFGWQAVDDAGYAHVGWQAADGVAKVSDEEGPGRTGDMGPTLSAAAAKRQRPM